MAFDQRLLERITNFAVLAAAIVVIVVYGMRMADRPSARLDELKGQTVAIQRITSAPAPTNVILALSTTCSHCEENAPLYRKLSEFRTPGRASLLAVFPQPISEARAYLGRHSLSVDQVASADLAAFKITGTPTVLVVDAQGKVLSAWVGALDQRHQAEILTYLQRAR